MLIGSDGGIGRSYPAGLDDLAYSIELHRRIGAPPGAAIAAATDLATSKIGMGDLVGRVTPSPQADLIAVTGEPERDVTLLAKPIMVMRRGKLLGWSLGRRGRWIRQRAGGLPSPPGIGDATAVTMPQALRGSRSQRTDAIGRRAAQVPGAALLGEWLTQAASVLVYRSVEVAGTRAAEAITVYDVGGDRLAPDRT